MWAGILNAFSGPQRAIKDLTDVRLKAMTLRIRDESGAHLVTIWVSLLNLCIKAESRMWTTLGSGPDCGQHFQPHTSPSTLTPKVRRRLRPLMVQGAKLESSPSLCLDEI